MNQERSYPKFVRISQGIINCMELAPEESTLADIIVLAEDVGKLSDLHLAEAPPALLWGTGIYEIKDNGALVFLKGDWDSSD